MRRLNWFSPLPPAMSDIAHYSARILPAMAKHFELTLWTDAESWDPDLENYANVRSYSATHPPPFADDVMNVFNLGNNRQFHGNIFHFCRAQAGIVVVHDLTIQHLVAGIYRDELNDLSSYRDHLEALYGAIGRYAAEAYWDNSFVTEFMAAHFACTELALRNALGVMVHTRRAFRKLTHDHLWPVRYHPLPYAPRDSETMGSRDNALPKRLIIFGFLRPNRRVEVILRTLASYPRRQQLQLDIYGEIIDRDGLLGLIAELGLSEIVNVRGFVSEEELDAALSRADLAINLRFPTMGEASGSQLRIWDHGLASLVTAIGSYLDLPPQTVGYVHPDTEVTDLQDHFDALLRHPAYYRRMGELGRKALLTLHSPDSYAEAMAELLEEADRFQKNAAQVGKEISRPATDVLGMFREPELSYS